MIHNIVEYTNRKIEEAIIRFENTDKYPYKSYVKIIDDVDLRAFIGIMYLRGLYGLNRHNIRVLFSDRHGMPVFGATMSRLRFEFILKYLSFDDHTTREERWKQDRFAAMREFFEKCNINFGKMMIPEDYLSLDETLYPMRTQIAFKQYNPDKPAKYGMLFKSINSARYPYTHQSHVYCGKPEGEPNEFYTAGTSNYVMFLVNKLSIHHNLSGRNLSMDRLYSSLALADWLLENGITMVGTMMKNRVGIPMEIKVDQHRDINSTEIYWEKNGSKRLLSYVVKTAKARKNVIMLSTVEPLLGTTMDDEKHKPALIKLYDFTKGGTDIVDQKIGFYTTKTKSRRWTMTAFSYLLDTIRVNAGTIYGLNNTIDPRKVDSFDFIFRLGESLVMPEVSRRPKQGLTSVISAKIRLFTGKVEEANVADHLYSQTVDVKTRCKICVSETHGADQKYKKDKLKKIKTACQKCGNATCNQHMMHICNTCNTSN